MNRFLRPALAAAAAALALAAPAHATTVNLAADGQWNAFDVSDLDAASGGTEWIDNNDSLSPDFGSALQFAFTVAAGTQATLTVVDGGFAGDRFTVTNHGTALGSTSVVPAQAYGAGIPDVGTDFDAALANAAFSHANFTLGAGSYLIGGTLLQSVTFDGSPLNATVGAVKLSVSAVPEASTTLLMLAGLLGIGFFARNRRI
jgi:hypothetical protein